ncbi:unnamed protein product, partial [Adineta ricciae]
MYMYRYEKRVKYYGHIENNDELIHAYGEALKQAQVGLETAFIVDGRAALNSTDDVKVVVTSPSKHNYHMKIINNRDGTWTVSYIPTEVGETYIDIFLGTELVYGSPFKVNIFDINQIHVSNIDGGVVGHLVKFFIDASKAGVGQLEIVVQDGLLP